MREKILALLKESDQPVSGEWISTKLGITRSAVNKHIKELRASGYTIHSKNRVGYKLEVTDVINQMELEAIVRELKLPTRCSFFDSIDSTNTEAKRVPTNVLIVARKQTAGRGRRGREWVSEEGDGIYFTLSLKPSLKADKLRTITLFSGLMLAESLGDGFEIKWPNDIYYEGKKLSGILTELVMELDFLEKLIIGIGVNLKTPEVENAIGLTDTPYFKGERRILFDFLERFFNNYDHFEKEGLHPFLDALSARDFLKGKTVKKTNDEKEYTYLGIDEEGYALLQGDSVIRVDSGEISLSW
ncbi:biotin--[acetyl-CoA-carboxylase] ligase [Guggenheimella bovis]